MTHRRPPPCPAGHQPAAVDLWHPLRARPATMSQPYALRVTLTVDAVDALALALIKAESPVHLVIVYSDHWHALLGLRA